MAEGRPLIGSNVEGEKRTSHDRGLDLFPRIVVAFLRINYVILAPWIILSLPPLVVGQQSILIAIVVATVGMTGMFLRNRAAVLLGSATLALLIVWGKVASDIYRLPGPDSALLLFQFMLVVSLMEASTTALTFDHAMKQLEGRDDDVSELERKRVIEWVRVQLLSLGKLTMAASGLSLGLVVLGSLISVSVNVLAFSGILVLASVVAILILLTYRREPEESRRSPN